MIKIALNWKDYECLDAGNKEKLERWNDVILQRPEPSALWQTDYKDWNKADAIFYRQKNGKGKWKFNKKLPEFWSINYKNLTFKVSPTNFKHTGIFPEQASNWDWMMDLISKENRDIKILNLFAYTGCATMACSYAGAKEIVHVDASKSINNWAKENMELCNLFNNTIRFITDDVMKFIQREIRRGNKYQGIIMDPPSYGIGPKNERWQIESQINNLIFSSLQLLDNNPLFFLVNSYTTGFSSIMLSNILKLSFNYGNIETGQLGLPITKNDLILPCGIYGKWTND